MSKEAPDSERPVVKITRKAPQPVKVQMDLADVPDRFMVLWQKVADKIIAYFSRAMLLVTGAILVFVAAWGVGQYMEWRREKATDMLGRVLRLAEADLLRDGEKADEDSDTPRYKTAAERTAAVQKALDDLDKEYGGSDAARRGMLVRAGQLYDQGKFADAEALYRKFVDGKPGETSLMALAYEGLGLCAETRSDFGAAITAFEQQSKEAFAHERALMNEARVYAKQGNKQKAIEIYKDLLAKATPQSAIRDDVQNRLAALEP